MNKRVLRGVEFKRVWLQSVRCAELVVKGLYRTGSKLKEVREREREVEKTRRVSSSVSEVTSTKDQAKTERFASFRMDPIQPQ